MERTRDKSRVVLLCVFLVVMGSPWARESLIALRADDSVLSLLHRALLAPGWATSPGSDPYTAAMDLRGNVAFLCLLAGTALLVPRTVGRAPAGRGGGGGGGGRARGGRRGGGL
ncbi:hypothetical protein ACE14D_13775, partial [Streptomyces sp. Act-28]